MTPRKVFSVSLMNLFNKAKGINDEKVRRVRGENDEGSGMAERDEMGE